MQPLVHGQLIVLSGKTLMSHCQLSACIFIVRLFSAIDSPTESA